MNIEIPQKRVIELFINKEEVELKSCLDGKCYIKYKHKDKSVISELKNPLIVINYNL